MYVKNYMTAEVITISEETKILEALDLMKDHQIHRLPVTKDGQIKGLVTEGIIQENSPSTATSLSIHEMNYLLTKTAVGDIMLKNVITIAPDALLEEAADTMRKNQVSVLPVIGTDHKLVGIITEKDIFAAFLDLLGYYNQGTRVVVDIKDDHTGILEKLTHLFTEEQMNIDQIAVYRQAGLTQVVIQVASVEVAKIKQKLMDNGYTVSSCSLKEG
ncbi:MULTISPECIES: CBS and ACT domain-containing protein [Carnobacterium]|uniref:CBS and ACT domain-containing protein n=1 Tax=Carnobacterium maltaromaticum TaxID=2751 RepID=A0AAW9JX01_CARML|nr:MULTISPECIES: CBS and ACT domain-containing protein [Carnobacterium]KRN85009.1 component of the acetoin degradation regulation pathway [Carnobacterium maltaromaticum]MBQ6484823.1 CBS domain-containing protein [Carnobacterium sp.]MDT1945465.1 CBS and ACT domain-containing protein [Carnobacterium maltaromaticum]MDT1999969.1 CBS and ACT domain-containing protein [Carnobacterium maltaromaticum]MDW5523414.1 CBS and ACT domain-containing protein [Carnobacterium maltaromaticum]